MESLSDKLRSLGVQIGIEKPIQSVAHKVLGIESVVPGYFFDSAYGQSYVVETEYNISSTSGMLNREHFIILSEWAGAPELPSIHDDEIIFLDTETSGLAGGTGSFAFMIGLGYFTDQNFKLVQLFMRDPSEEPGLIAALHHFLGNFKAVVTYNGKSFDIPLLSSRHIINSFTSPFGDACHLDLLPLARRLWRNRLPSRALKDLEIELLNVRRTQDEVPGWMVPELYYNYLRNRDATPLAGVFYHNGMDVVSLAGLFNYTAALLSHPLDHPDIDSLDLIAIARLYDHLGRVDEAIQIYERSLTQGLPVTFYRETIIRFAMIYRKRNDWRNAVYLWEKGAQNFSISACVELSKYYEHHERDNIKALHWARTARDMHQEGEATSRDNLLARIERLMRKICKVT